MTPQEWADQIIAWFKREAKYDRGRDKYEWPGVLVWASLNVHIADAIAAAILAEKEGCAEITDIYFEQTGKEEYKAVGYAIRARTATEAPNG